MAEGGILPVRILGFAQTLDAVVHRNGQHIDGNARRADAYAGHGGADLPLGPGVHGQGIRGLQRAFIHNGADGIVEGGHVHAYADAGFQAAGAGTGLVVYLHRVSRVDLQGIGGELAAHDPAGHMGIDIVHRDAAGDAGAEDAHRRAYGNQLGLQGGLVAGADGKIRGRTAVRLLQGTVLHIGGNGGVLIDHAHAHVQRTGHAGLNVGGDGHARVYIQVIDTVFVAGFHLRVFRIIRRGIGHQGHGRTVHLVCVHVVAGLYG